MWGRAFLFSMIAANVYGKIVSMDICADAWVLEHYKSEDIGAITFLSEKEEGIAQHRGTTEELLTLLPSLVVSEHPLSLKQKRKLYEQSVSLKVLPPLNTISDLYQRFPQAKPNQFPNLGQGRTVLMITHGLHSPGMQTFWNDVLDKMGFKNATANMGIKGWGYVSLEKILLAKPSLIILLGEDVTLHPCLKHIAVQRIPSQYYLCPSPKSLTKIVGLLADAYHGWPQ